MLLWILVFLKQKLLYVLKKIKEMKLLIKLENKSRLNTYLSLPFPIYFMLSKNPGYFFFIKSQAFLDINFFCIYIIIDSNGSSIIFIIENQCAKTL